jgi:hypothetical protein
MFHSSSVECMFVIVKVVLTVLLSQRQLPCHCYSYVLATLLSLCTSPRSRKLSRALSAWQQGLWQERSLLYTRGKHAICLKIHVRAADINLRTRGFLKLKFVRDSMSTTTPSNPQVSYNRHLSPYMQRAVALTPFSSFQEAAIMGN